MSISMVMMFFIQKIYFLLKISFHPLPFGNVVSSGNEIFEEKLHVLG